MGQSQTLSVQYDGHELWDYGKDRKKCLDEAHERHGLLRENKRARRRTSIGTALSFHRPVLDTQALYFLAVQHFGAKSAWESNRDCQAQLLFIWYLIGNHIQGLGIFIKYMQTIPNQCNHQSPTPCNPTRSCGLALNAKRYPAK